MKYEEFIYLQIFLSAWDEFETLGIGKFKGFPKPNRDVWLEEDYVG